MRFLILTFLCLTAYCSIGQTDAKQQKKLNKIFADNFKELSPIDDYAPYFECKECTMDTSKVYMNRMNGARYNNQFILHHDPISFGTKQEAFRFIRTDFVTNVDYQEFQDWTRDSIARCEILLGLSEDEEAAEFGSFELIRLTDSRRYTRKLTSLNWEHNFSYDDPELVPILAMMYKDVSQRYYKQREFDYTGYMYQYTEQFNALKGLKYDSVVQIFNFAPDVLWSSDIDTVKNEVPVFRNKFEIAKAADHLRDERSVLAELDEQIFMEFPVHGIDGFQANAFCDWKTNEIQAQLNAAELPFYASVTLPIKDDVVNEPSVSVDFKMDGRDYTEQWTISNEDYLEFMEFVEDSITREFLYLNLQEHIVASRFLDHPKYYFSEPDLEYVSFDGSDRDVNRQIFNLNYDQKTDKNNGVIPYLLQTEAYKLQNKTMFKYFPLDAKGLGLDGRFKERVLYNGSSKPDTIWSPDYFDEGLLHKESYKGEYNQLGEPSAKRVHKYLQAFIMEITIDVSPDHKNYPSDDESIMQFITYDQALAYYYWKTEIQLADEELDWQNYVLPSLKEFEIIQSKGRVVKDQKTITYPASTFKYVVHLYPK